MKILFLGNKERGISCLKIIIKSHEIIGVIGNKKSSASNYFVDKATRFGFNVLQPEDINNLNFIKKIQNYKPDICVLAGYGSIVKSNFISVAKHGCINLHAGKLPKYRGSSPLNWSLINGDKNFSLTIINVDKGVDTGSILIEKSFPIEDNYTIVELHQIANTHFPKLLIEVLDKIENKTIVPVVQNEELSSYYPLRFPEDGVVFLDQVTAEEIHNQIRALTTPYPGVLAFYNNKKIKIIHSSLTKRPFYGEPGRIYRISKKKGILVCAKDKCLWLEHIIDNKTGASIINSFKRYDVLGTFRDIAIKLYDN